MPRIGSSSNALMEPRSSISLQLQQLTLTTRNAKKAQLKKPHHLAPVLTPALSACGSGRHLLEQRMPSYLDLTVVDVDERRMFNSSKQLRSMVSTTMARDKRESKPGRSSLTSQPHVDLEDGRNVSQKSSWELDRPIRKISNNHSSDSFRPDIVLSKIDDMLSQTQTSSRIISSSDNNSAIDVENDEHHGFVHGGQNTQQRQRSAHIRNLQYLRDRSAPSANIAKTSTDSPHANWSQIHLINGMDGTTLARYRRLVGMAARRNLHQMISTATQRVVIHRKQNESAMKIQACITAFLLRKRQQRRTRLKTSALRLQCCWRSMCARMTLRLLREKRDRYLWIARRAVELREYKSAMSIQRRYREHLTWKLHVWRREHACQQLAVLWQLRQKQTNRRPPADVINELVIHSGPLNEVEAAECPEEQANCDLVRTASDRGLEPQDGNICALDAAQENRHQLSVSVQAVDQQHGKTSCEMTKLEANCLNASPERDIPASSLCLEYEGDSVDLVLDVEEDTAATAGLVAVVSSYLVSQAPAQNNLMALAVGGAQSDLEATVVALSRNHELVHERRDVTLSEEGALGSACNIEIAPHDHNIDPIVQQPQQLCSDQEKKLFGSALTTLTRFVATWKRRRHVQASRVYNMRYHAAVKIQYRVRCWLARKHVRLVRNLELISLRNELEQFWLEDDALYRSTFAFSDPAVEIDTSRRYQRDESSDDDDIEIEYEPFRRVQDFLPLKDGLLPPGVPVNLTHSGSWKWSWSMEAWTSARSVFSAKLDEIQASLKAAIDSEMSIDTAT